MDPGDSDMKKNRAGLKQLRNSFHNCGTTRDSVFGLCRTQESGMTTGLFITKYSYQQHRKRTRKSRKAAGKDMYGDAAPLQILDSMPPSELVSSEDFMIPVVFDSVTQEYMLASERNIHGLHASNPLLNYRSNRTKQGNKTSFWTKNSVNINPITLPTEYKTLDSDVVSIDHETSSWMRIQVADPDIALWPEDPVWTAEITSKNSLH